MPFPSALFTAFLFALIVSVLALAALYWLDVSPLVRARRMKKLKGPHEGSPLMGSGLHGDVRAAFEPVLAAWAAADPSLLPPRMDKAFREMSVRSLNTLRQNGLCRVLRFADVDAIKNAKNRPFTGWNDGGREWRECTIAAGVLESYVLRGEGTVLSERYYPRAFLTVRQSRHIRAAELAAANRAEKGRMGKKGGGTKEFYASSRTFTCPSCGAQLEAESAELTCPYCGGAIHAEFFDWQTESLVFEEGRAREALLLTGSAALFTTLFGTVLLMLLGGDLFMDALALGIALIAGIVLMNALVLSLPDHIRKKREGEIVRYSERALQAAVYESLRQSEGGAGTVDFTTAPLKLERVTNTEDTTTVSVSVKATRETVVTENGKIRIERKTSPHTLSFTRARYPERLKSRGEVLRERDCPSCGANFEPDENGCCSWCGYGLRTDGAKWKPVRKGQA